MISPSRILLLYVAVAVSIASSPLPALVPHAEDSKPVADWIPAMRQVHARFRGTPGTIAHFGDSITVTQAYWAPLKYAPSTAPPDIAADLKTVMEMLRPECWSEWKGPRYGSEGGKTSQWAQENVGKWLSDLNPEVAIIMFGTNDLQAVPVKEFRQRMEAVVKQCLVNGTVVILSTIPPRHGYEEKSAEFSAAVRQVAADLRVPLTDYHAAILKRRPNDWDGALDRFRSFEGYDVPTLISRDGVHPSLPKAYQDDYSPEGLMHSGYNLRNVLALQKTAEVLRAIRAAKPSD